MRERTKDGVMLKAALVRERRERKARRARVAGLALAALLGAGIGGCAAAPAREPVQVEALTEAFDQEAFQAAVTALMLACPLDHGVQVRVYAIPYPVWGMTGFNELTRTYDIHIEARQEFHALVDTLVHEWAHAMVWSASEGAEYDSHGPLWGVSYARCYRAVLAALMAHYGHNDRAVFPEHGKGSEHACSCGQH